MGSTVLEKRRRAFAALRELCEACGVQDQVQTSLIDRVDELLASVAVSEYFTEARVKEPVAGVRLSERRRHRERMRGLRDGA